MHPRLLFLSALALLLPALPLSAADKLVMRQHWESGKVYRFETNMDMEMAVPGLPGGGQTTTVIQQMDAAVSTEAGTGRKLVEMKYTAVKAMINAAGQLMTYDSSDPAMSQPMLQQAFGALVGKSVTLIYDKDDKFLDAMVPEGFMATPLGAGNGPDGKQFASMLRESVDFGLPEAGLAVGDTFEVDKKLQMQPIGTISTKMKGRFDSITDREGRKHAKLVMEGTMEMPEASPGVNAVVSMLPGTKLTSEVLFDLERKAATVTTINNDIKMSIGGREMAMKQTMVTTLKSIENAPVAKK